MEITPQNKREIDEILHGIAGIQYKNCSPAWKKIKEMTKGDESSRDEFVVKLKEALG